MIIEIIVVIAGLVTAFIFLPTEETSEARMQYALALPFVVAAIAELTKIPLATAFYYAELTETYLLGSASTNKFPNF